MYLWQWWQKVAETTETLSKKRHMTLDFFFPYSNVGYFSNPDSKIDFYCGFSSYAPTYRKDPSVLIWLSFFLFHNGEELLF